MKFAMRGPQPWKSNRARVLRSHNVVAEANLWMQLRGRRLGGFKFVSQAPIGPYFVNFLCREALLIVEVDGGTHGKPEELAADAKRQKELKQLGYAVVRICNGDVSENIDGVLQMLLAELNKS